MATTTAPKPTSADEHAGSPNGGNLAVAPSKWRDPRDQLVRLALTAAPIALVVDMFFFSVIVALPNRLAWSIKQHCPRHRPAVYLLRGCH